MLFRSRYGLALDFFHLAPRDHPLMPGLARLIEDGVRRQLYRQESDEASLPAVTGDISLKEWRPNQYCLRFETTQDANGLIYALTYKVYRHLGGNIFGLTAQAARGKSYLSVYHSLPPDLPIESARAIMTRLF